MEMSNYEIVMNGLLGVDYLALAVLCVAFGLFVWFEIAKPLYGALESFVGFARNMTLKTCRH